MAGWRKANKSEMGEKTQMFRVLVDDVGENATRFETMWQSLLYTIGNIISG